MKAQVRCIKMQESDLHHRSKAFIKAGSQPASENSDHIENGSCFLLVNDASHSNFNIFQSNPGTFW